jgi:hypothetical protein
MLPSLLYSAKPNRYLNKLTPAHFETHATSCSKRGHLRFERHRHTASKLSYDPDSLWVKLSHGLVLAG